MTPNLNLLFTALQKAAADDFQFKAKHKNPEGGLSEAGRKAYNRATGGNLKRPQPEGGSRRDSFCARMKGMKKKLTSKETARDPDSRINKALRKWKCSYDMSEVKEAAKRRGLWANIHAKRERGEAPAKPGEEGYPDKKNWKKVTEESEKEAARCWKGYEPVPGKEPYSDDSCRPISAGKKKKTNKSAGLFNFLNGQSKTNEQIPSIEQLYPFNSKAKLDLDPEFIKYTKPWTDYTFETIKNKKLRVNPDEADDLIFTHIEQPLAANLISMDEAQRRLNLVRYGSENPVENWMKIKDFGYEDELLPPMSIAANDWENFQNEVTKRQALMDALKNKEKKKEAKFKLLSSK